MQNGSTVSGSSRTNRMLYGLIFLAMFMSVGHHIDHVIRGNHVGWPSQSMRRPSPTASWSTAHLPGTLPVRFGQGRSGLLGDRVGCSVRGCHPLRSYRRRTPG
jgi:hypothetical protein